MTTPARHARLWAVLWGIACHGLFALAIAAMFAGLYSGMRVGRGTLSGAAALAADLALVLQFPLLHSALLSTAGRRVLARLAPPGLGRGLAPTTYAALASVQLLATFLLWSPLGDPLWRPTGGLAVAWHVPLALSWAFLGKALLDGGLGLQTGWIGWTAVLRGRAPDYGPLRETGLFARCRQPIYLGFATTLWTGPVWTIDHALVALVWTSYCAFGPRLKERRYARIFGASFESYRRRVPHMIPRFTR